MRPRGIVMSVDFNTTSMGGSSSTQLDRAPIGEPKSKPSSPPQPTPDSQALFETIKSGKGASLGQGIEPKLEQPFEELSSVISQALDFRHLTSQQTAANGVAEAQIAQASSETNSSVELAEKLVARVLVSEPTAGSQEARLMVDPSLLPDTEIRLTRGLDGFLNVTVLTSDPGSMQALVQARNDLERALQKTEGASFRLELTENSGQTEAETGQPDRRSRGRDWQS
jgi:type III secretion system needle length determinant